MIEETALVTSRDGAFARVETRRNTACGDCHASTACGMSLLSKFFGYRTVSLRALNPIDARLGDEVVVGLEESALTRASVIFYLVPILLLILFAVVGQLLAESYGFVSAEPGSAVGGLLGLLMGLVLARRNAIRANRNSRNQAVILRLANSFRVEARQ